MLILGTLLIGACADPEAPAPSPRQETVVRQPALRPRVLESATADATTATAATAPRVAAESDSPGFIQVATGENHTCALRGDGLVECWGANDQGQLNVPEGQRFKQITSGWRFSCGIQPGGQIQCWGRNSYQQAEPPSGEFTLIDAGWDHACALSGTTAMCWGRNANERATPPAGVEFATIGAGAEHSCGLSTGGDLVCWGKNDDGRADSRDGPFRALAVGIAHTCVLDRDQTVLCQGDNTAGQSEPPDTSFVQISAGSNHTCGLLASGHVECWGAMEGEARNAPFGPPGRLKSLSAGWHNSCATNQHGHAACWSTLVRPRGSESHDGLLMADYFPGITFEQATEVNPWPSGELAIADRSGTIVLLTSEASVSLLLDLTDIVASGVSEVDERGLLSVALDPRFEEFPFMYLYYTVQDPRNEDITFARLSRFPIVDGKPVRGQELILLDIPRDPEAARHYGGAIRFGPDGMLYLGIGDAECFECPQRLDSLHGKIIRVDVRGASVDAPYKIPDDNPFREEPETLPEIWAYGLRNPWRMAFDFQNGKLWVGDVGEANYEEVNIATAGSNLGWPITEGFDCFEVSESTAGYYNVSMGFPCRDTGHFVEPIVAYEHVGKCAIVGGLVYRGTAIPWLNGTYLFGDYCSGQVWALDGDAESGWRMIEIVDLDKPLSSFGLDADGEVLVLTFGGPVLRLVEAESRFAPSVTHVPLVTTVITPLETDTATGP